MEQGKHTTVILPNKGIQDLKDQVTKLTSQRDQFQKEAIEAKIKVEKMKLVMEGIKIERPNTNVIL